jgi:hypothetical protein
MMVSPSEERERALAAATTRGRPPCLQQITLVRRDVIKTATPTPPLAMPSEKIHSRRKFLNFMERASLEFQLSQTKFAGCNYFLIKMSINNHSKEVGP